MNPPTWAKNATPPPLAEALDSPKLASMSWYKNHSPRKIQAGILTRKIGKIHVRIRDTGYGAQGLAGPAQLDASGEHPVP